MREIPPPDPPERRSELTSLVYIMRGRSPFSHLGILDLRAGSLSLRDANGGQLFAVPAETAQARPAWAAGCPAAQLRRREVRQRVKQSCR
jgi:hypothetical protein